MEFIRETSDFMIILILGNTIFGMLFRETFGLLHLQCRLLSSKFLDNHCVRAWFNARRKGDDTRVAFHRLRWI
jgi:hypothetical protein